MTKKSMNIHIDIDLYEWLDEMANVTGISKTFMVNKAVRMLKEKECKKK